MRSSILRVLERMRAPGWQFWIDRGGTFTDVIGLSPRGELHIRKLLSAEPGGAGADPGIRGARALLGSAGEPVEAVKVGTTVATNALLERKGEPVLLVTTAGFGAALRIGYQNRPDIFSRHIVLPEPVYSTVIETRERIDCAGAILTPLDGRSLRTDLQRARQAGLRSVAIIFLHGWRHPQQSFFCMAGGIPSTSVRRPLSPASSGSRRFPYPTSCRPSCATSRAATPQC